jgi:RNA polymerase sigma-70 factor (ECF subfamily)
MVTDSTTALLIRARDHDERAVGELLNRYRDRLHRFVNIRMDDRLRGRVDPSDVIQEACLAATIQMPAYFQQEDIPFYIWLRLITAQKLVGLHRHHLHVKARNARRDMRFFNTQLPEASSALLAAQLLGRTTGPSQAAIRAEQQRRLQEVLDRMEPSDREIIVLRHFEQLTNSEAARLMGWNESTTSTRHLRALKRLKAIVGTMPEFRDLV